ncbi:bifunctional tRNA (5-methylaminomethyl-2-thiouridine)(34)-methyltransferase MnmD/FAD-dependent 5-carboxymethylaminomethyl-2-thiouridine(34) oxidoreductase MnmC [Glaciecola sp. MF2-115]|uniref:bifunctional tRNA (5-methylaminomethyl-2-thiouridine)(34)-methyltransferase MnmD/FAD-dependent 5-carboxymethylaminomethyl-2-thiouridine(34) oxidoreductase MnmC n=1 Tax=Glaciecola sp. MF2-115 TaxID=3384827 RepID=UPI0039A1D7B2
MKISNANISFNENGTPVASTFDDVYFSNDSGIKETQYVFIDSNKLNERWLASTESSFHIGETGFGTGLNLLVAAQQFQAFREKHPTSPLTKLYFLSTEKFPLSKADLIKALSLWPELSDFSQDLISVYPIPLPGMHRIHLFNGLVVLDLWLGDATDGFTQTHSHLNGRIDAWFLDGFAPSKNDSMWQIALFTQLKRLSREDASFATFTAAGVVKRGLRDAGFAVHKQKGFGRKREMLVGNLSIENASRLISRQAPIYHRHTPTLSLADKKKEHVSIVGGGIAAAICAYKLIQAGKKVSLYCADTHLAQGASGNEQGGFYPQLNAEAGIASQIHAHSFLYARRFYDQLISEGNSFKHQWCGVLQLCFNENVTSRYQAMIRNQTWPQSLVTWLEPKQASTIANVDIPYSSLYLPLGGWLSPPDLVRACVQAASDGDFELHLDHRLIEIFSREDGQSSKLVFNQSETNSNKVIDADIVILACGAESHLLKELNLPFRMTRGQVERIPTNAQLSKLDTVLCHKGYMTPANDAHHAMGSTYVKNDLDTAYRDSEGILNLNMHKLALSKATWSSELELNKDYDNAAENDILKSEYSDENLKGRAAIRCSLPDHLPAVGCFPEVEVQKRELHELYKAKAESYYPIPSVKPDIYLLTGLGSRGLTTAPLMAEILVSQICGQPLPLDNNLLNALNPNRFLVRDLIRRR